MPKEAEQGTLWQLIYQNPSSHCSKSAAVAQYIQGMVKKISPQKAISQKCANIIAANFAYFLKR